MPASTPLDECEEDLPDAKDDAFVERNFMDCYDNHFKFTLEEKTHVSVRITSLLPVYVSLTSPHSDAHPGNYSVHLRRVDCGVQEINIWQEVLTGRNPLSAEAHCWEWRSVAPMDAREYDLQVFTVQYDPYYEWYSQYDQEYSGDLRLLFKFIITHNVTQ